MKTVRKNISISDLKLKGTQPIDEKVKYTTIVQTALMSISRKYNIRLVLDIGKHHKRGKQWTTLEEIKKRQRREDRVTDDVRRRIINFCLSPDLSREVPNKNEVMKIKESTKVELNWNRNISCL